VLGQFILAAIVSAGSGYSDLKVRRIPNLFTLSGIIIGFLLNTLLFRFQGFKMSLFGFLIGFCFFFIFYLIGGMGAGDVKLMGAIGAILGYPLIYQAFFYTAISGIIVIIIMFFPLIIDALRNKNLSNLTSIRKKYIPYGIAISAGTLITIIINYNKVFP
jgi:prepilin peptidase CpaA